MRTNPSGRRSNRARLQRFEELTSQEFQKRSETKDLYIPPGPRLGDVVVEAKNLRKSFGERMLVEDLSTLPPGGIIGRWPNGAGKTSLLRMIAGAETPDAGELRIGETVQVSYVDQSRDSLNGDSTVWQEVSGGLDLIEIEGFQLQSRAYVGRFNFKGTEQEKRVNLWRGAQPVHLAKLLVSGGNLLPRRADQ